MLDSSKERRVETDRIRMSGKFWGDLRLNCIDSIVSVTGRFVVEDIQHSSQNLSALFQGNYRVFESYFTLA